MIRTLHICVVQYSSKSWNKNSHEKIILIDINSHEQCIYWNLECSSNLYCTTFSAFLNWFKDFLASSLENIEQPLPCFDHLGCQRIALWGRARP